MAKTILHMITALAHMSPFDVNMALDAGYDSVTPYTNVALGDVTGLTQDAMFSRAPRDATRTGLFIAGKDAFLALDMLDAAKKALLKPFEISLFLTRRYSYETTELQVPQQEKYLLIMRYPEPNDIKNQTGLDITAIGKNGTYLSTHERDKWEKYFKGD